MTIDVKSWPGIPANLRGWGPGWPNCQTDKWITAPKPVFGKARDAITPLLALLIAETEKRGYHLKGDGLTAGTSQCWGADCRPVKQSDGTLSDVPSNHSWGLAVDLNSIDNHYGGATHDIPTWMADLWNEYGWRWGGSWSANTKDWMHFDFMGTPADAAVMTAKALADFADDGGFLMALTDAEQTEMLNKVRRTQQFVKGVRQAREGATASADDTKDNNYMAGRELWDNVAKAAGA